MTRAGALVVVLASLGCMACGTSPPASQMPNARAALDRLHATQDCGLGIQAAAKIDHFGKGGRVRGDLLMFALWPARLRMDVVGPMNVGVVATLTSDASKFTLADLREKRFLYGPASACNIARLTTVPMPGHVLVSLLRGEAPVLKHEPAAASIAWSTSGYYVIKIASSRNAQQELHIAPHPSDFPSSCCSVLPIRSLHFGDAPQTASCKRSSCSWPPGQSPSPDSPLICPRAP